MFNNEVSNNQLTINSNKKDATSNTFDIIAKSDDFEWGLYILIGAVLIAGGVIAFYFWKHH